MGEKLIVLLIVILLIVVWLIPMSILCETYNNTNKIRANQTKIIKNQIVITKAIKAVHPHHKKIRMHMITK